MRSLRRYICKRNIVEHVLAINHYELASLLEAYHERLFIRNSDLWGRDFTRYSKNYRRVYRGYTSPIDAYYIVNCSLYVVDVMFITWADIAFCVQKGRRTFEILNIYSK